MRAATLLVVLLASCSSSPPLPADQRFERLSWARIGADQAYAECRADIQRNPLLSLTSCMSAKGWRERR